MSTWLRNSHPIAFMLGVLLTLIVPKELKAQPEPVVRDGEVIRLPPKLDTFQLSRLADLLREPIAILRTEYVTALETEDDAAAMADKVFARIAGLLRLLGISCRYGITPGDEPLLGDAAKFMKYALIVYTDDVLLDAPAEAGVVFSLSPASLGDLGLVASPFGALNFTKEFESWTIESTLGAEVDAVAWGHHGLTILADATTTEVSASLAATATQEEGAAFVLGSRQGSRLELGLVRLAADTALSEERQSLSLAVDLKSAVLVLSQGESDGFLAGLLPSEGLRTEFDVGLSWSSDRGLTLRGQRRPRSDDPGRPLDRRVSTFKPAHWSASSGGPRRSRNLG